MTDDYLRDNIRQLVALRFGVTPERIAMVPGDARLSRAYYAALTPENKTTVLRFVRDLYRAQCATKGDQCP